MSHTPQLALRNATTAHHIVHIDKAANIPAQLGVSSTNLYAVWDDIYNCLNNYYICDKPMWNETCCAQEAATQENYYDDEDDSE